MSLFSIGLLASCTSSNSDLLKVRQYHLKSVNPAEREAQMIRGEQMHRLRGAVTLEERRARLGQYYIVNWKNDSPPAAQMQLVMDYQQTATGSKTLRMRRHLPVHLQSGKIEFHITGKSYQTGGRVLAWRIRLLRDNETIAEEKSYLWR